MDLAAIRHTFAFGSHEMNTVHAIIMSARHESENPRKPLPFWRRFRGLATLESSLLVRSLTSWLIAASVSCVLLAGALSSSGVETAAPISTPLLKVEQGYGVTSRFWALTTDLAHPTFPFLAFLFGYEVFLHDRERGTRTCIGSLPVTRWDIYVSKVGTRTGVFAAIIVVGSTVAATFMAVSNTGTDLSSLFIGTSLTVALGVSLLSPMIALSTLLSTRTQGLLTVVGGGFAMVMGLGILLTNRSSFVVLHPVQAYSRLLASLDPDVSSPVLDMLIPWLRPPSVSVAILVAWIVGPIVIGFIWFRARGIE